MEVLSGSSAAESCPFTVRTFPWWLICLSSCRSVLDRKKITLWNSFISLPHVVNDAGKNDINEGDGEVEEEPDVDHLDVGGDRKASNN